MEKGLQNGLKCILRDIDFKKFTGGAPPYPPSMSRGFLAPLTACAARFKSLA